MAETPFNTGDVVRRKDLPDQVGRVTGLVWNEQLSEWQVKVQFGTRALTVSENSIEALPDEIDPWQDVINGRASTARQFRSLMTFERLVRPVSRIASCFGSARTLFFPYQFKPLLKLLDSPRWRILIADEVGLGKTIEAGYVLRELRARSAVRRVLVVVPARLKEKWRFELRTRFDEVFEVPTSARIIQFLADLEGARDDGEFNWIVSYEQIRRADIREKFERLDPLLDLLVLDEGHRVRHTGTLQHKIAEVLGECAEAMLILTATPLQTSVDDLYSLLNLLDAESFSSRELFYEQLSAQEPVMDTLRLLRDRNARPKDLRDSLSRLLSHRLHEGLERDPLFQSIRERCESIHRLERRDRVALERDVTELSFTTHYFTRTRKRDVLIDRPWRCAQSVKIELSPIERRIFEGIERLHTRWNGQSMGWGAAMALVTVMRYTASCLPASLEYLASKRSSSIEDLLTDIAEETEAADGWVASMDSEGRHERSGEPQPSQGAVSLHELLENGAGGIEIDTKLRKFLDLLAQVWEEDFAADVPPRKVVVFAFFKRTINYLESMLRRKDIGALLISGDIPLQERETRISRFRDDPKIRVLLSSEVGSEGLDLQFASVVVNYDLPWNPMVVEQRIGRIDRIGQLAKKILVCNLYIQDSVEERVLMRLYERINLFEASIGELDPILGERVEEIAIAAVTGQLSEEEQLQKSNEAADAILKQRQQADQLDSSADVLFAADQAFLDEIETMVRGRRIPDNKELVRFLAEFFSEFYPGSKVPLGIANSVGKMHLHAQVAGDLLRTLGNDFETQKAYSVVHSGAFDCTVDSEVALARRGVELIHRRHPLIRFVTAKIAERLGEVSRSFALRLPAAAARPVGTFLFSVMRFAVRGPRQRFELLPFVVDLSRGKILDEEIAQTLLVDALIEGDDVMTVPQCPPKDIVNAKEKLEATIEATRASMRTREEGLERARAARIRATQLASLENKIAVRKRVLQRLKDNESQELAIRLAADRVRVVERERAELLAGHDQSPSVAIEIEELAVGLLAVI